MSTFVGASKTVTLDSRPVAKAFTTKASKKRGRPRSKSAPVAAVSIEKCGKKRKQWSNEAMKAAMKSVSDENTPVSQAAKIHGVPKSTLHDRISGKVYHGDKPGPEQLLSPVEEEEIANFLIEVAQAGCGKTRKEVRNIPGRVAVDKRGRRYRLYHMGGQRFMQRQPHLSYRKGDPTVNVRMNCLTKQLMYDYFDLLKEVLTTNQLLDSTSRIYNVDETGIALDGHAPQVVAKREQKK